MAQARACDDHAPVAHGGQTVDDVGVEVGIVVLDRDLLFEDGRDDGYAGLVAPEEVVRDVLEVTAILIGVAAHGRQGRGPDGAESAAVRGVHLPAAGTTVQQVIVIGGGPEHAEHHFRDVTLGGGAHGSHQIQGGVGGRPVRAALAAHHHDGHGAVLHHEA